jgi:hypothetical protein
MQSTVADAYVGWLKKARPEYQHGSGTQLFVWDAPRHLEPL